MRQWWNEVTDQLTELDNWSLPGYVQPNILDWLIDWSLMALSAQYGYIVPLEVIVCVSGNRNTLGVLYISYSVADDQRHK